MSAKHTLQLSNNTSVSYWEYNPGKKQVIVMVHGFRGTHHGLEKIVEALPMYRIIVPDLPGFGESPAFADQPHSLESYVTFLDDFIAALGLHASPVLLGHSFGSIIASHFAAEHTEAIDKLILVNPISAPALQGPRGVMTRLAIMYYWLGRTLPPAASKPWLANKAIVKVMSKTMAKTKDPAMLEFIHDQHLRHFSTFASPQVVAEAFRASVTSDVTETVHKLNVETLLIVGDKDDITPLEKQQDLAKKIPGATLVTLQNVGHLIHYEKPAEAATAIQAFLQQ
ncbi:MAG TPA: alpha/beta hydrolase [Candidatus Saccharimonadales bacterium]|nr:alpha/beta hydrolase [Candidatus Saccharimonadales bacterium]